MKLQRLFEPITINKVTIKNRTVMPAMALFYTVDYSLTDRFEAFYRERARGGVGFMVMGPMAIEKRGSNPFMLGLHEDRFTDRLKRFVDSLRKETDVRIGVQLMHQGHYASSKLSGIAPIAPSSLRSRFTGEIPREMTEEDIEEVKEAFARAALRAKEAGVDFVELMAGGGYLIGEFLSPVTNRREDRYGGPLENRMRFGLEAIERVRKALGPDVAFGIRMSGQDFLPGGNTIAEASIFAVEAEKAVDYINVTGGWHETQVPQITTDVPPGTYVYLARTIKEKVKVPVCASNRLGDPLIAEKVLRSGSADMVCVGRPLIADPYLPNKAKSGRLDEIVPCIACNQGCLDAIFSGSPVTCTVNPRVGREGDTEIKEAPIKKKIFVAGGGVGGMEFALTAAQKGHYVTLYEEKTRLGGQVNLIGSLPYKELFVKAARSFEKGMNIRGVKVELGRSLTSETVKAEKPDLLVVATGAVPSQITLPGIDLPHVVDGWDVLDGTVSHIGKRVVVIGGGATGCELALFVATMDTLAFESFGFLVYHKADDFERLRNLLYLTGRKITVIEITDKLASNMGNSTRWSLLKDLKLMNVDLRMNTRVISLEEKHVIVETSEGTEKIRADTVIIAVGARALNNLEQELRGTGIDVITLGDAVAPRKILDAVREGFDRALET